MKNPVALTLWLGVATTLCSPAQNLTFRKSEIKTINDVGITLPFEQRGRLIKEFDNRKMIEANQRTLSEKTLYDLNGTKIAINYSNGKAELIKYVNNNAVAQRSFDRETEISPIDETEKLISVPTIDGGGMNVVFLAADLKNESAYIPFQNGFKEVRIGYSDKLVCVFSVSDSDNKIYKLAILDHNGRLIIERQFDLGNFGTSDIKINDNQIFILLNNHGSAEAKILSFDHSLNLVWERSFSNRFSGYSIEQNDISVLAITQDQIFCINSSDGQNRWVLPTDEVYGKVGAKSFSHSYCLNNTDIVIVISSFSHEKFNDNKLIVLDNKTGKKKYVEELGVFDSCPQVIGTKDGFILSAGNQTFIYAVAK